MAPKKKPTMREMESVVSQVISRQENLMQRNLNLEVVLSSYIEFKKDNEEFAKHLQEKTEKIAKDRAESSVRDDKQQVVSESK